MKKIFILLPLLFILTGCNSYIELNELGIINIISIEKNNNDYKLNASIIEDVEKNGTPISKIYESNGKTIFEAIDNLGNSLNKKIYLSHLDLLIINETIKTNELEEIINYFLNNNESRNNFLIVNTNNTNDVINNTTWQEINNLIKLNEKENSKAIYTTMYDLINNYYKKEPIYLTNIDFNNKIFINGITKLYNNKYSLIEDKDTIFINYLLNNINTYKINFDCSDNKYLYLNILTSNTNNINNKIIITNEIKVITNDCNLDKKKINNMFNSYLKDNIKKYTNKNIIIQNTIRSIYENN